MAVKLETLQYGPYLLIEVSGVVMNAGSVLDIGKELTEIATGAGQRRVLIVEADCTFRNFDAFEARRAASMISEAIPRHGLRMACVPEPGNLPILKLFETMFQNRSIMLRVFKGRKDAIEWLQVGKDCNDRDLAKLLAAGTRQYPFQL